MNNVHHNLQRFTTRTHAIKFINLTLLFSKFFLLLHLISIYMQVCVVCACTCIGHTCAPIINTVHITDLFQDFFYLQHSSPAFRGRGTKEKEEYHK
jgi:hypothetical protein